MFEYLGRPHHTERREHKKLINACKKFQSAYQTNIMEFLTQPSGEITSMTLPFFTPVEQKIIDEFRTLAFTVEEMKDLTREEGYDKMCIEQELLGGCDRCPYNDYCCGFGKALR